MSTDTGKREPGDSFEIRKYLDIEVKLGKVRDELENSGKNKQCLVLIQRALKVWPVCMYVCMYVCINIWACCTHRRQEEDYLH